MNCWCMAKSLVHYTNWKKPKVKDGLLPSGYVKFTKDETNDWELASGYQKLNDTMMGLATKGYQKIERVLVKLGI